MRTIMQVISWLALAGTILPAILFYQGRIELGGLKWAMLVATLLWFTATSMWMGRETPDPQEERQEKR
jgi:hypothetical protein